MTFQKVPARGPPSTVTEPSRFTRKQPPPPRSYLTWDAASEVAVTLKDGASTVVGDYWVSVSGGVLMSTATWPVSGGTLAAAGSAGMAVTPAPARRSPACTSRPGERPGGRGIGRGIPDGAGQQGTVTAGEYTQGTRSRRTIAGR